MSGGRRNDHYGRLAEDAAAAHYERAGGRVLARRARTAAGEIDLVVAHGEDIVFVEVKARRHLAAAEVALSPRQVRRIGRAALLWLDAAGHAAPMAIRFDLVLVDRQGGFEVIEAALSFDP